MWWEKYIILEEQHMKISIKGNETNVTVYKGKKPLCECIVHEKCILLPAELVSPREIRALLKREKNLELIHQYDGVKPINVYWPTDEGFGGYTDAKYGYVLRYTYVEPPRPLVYHVKDGELVF